MKCSNCGKEIANDGQFCEYCGAKINLTGTEDNYSRRNQNSTKQYSEINGKRKKILCYIFAVLSVMLTIFCMNSIPIKQQEIARKKSLCDSLYSVSDSLKNITLLLKDSIIKIQDSLELSYEFLGDKDRVIAAENEKQLSQYIKESERFVSSSIEKMCKEHEEALIAYKEVRKRHPNSQSNVYIDLGLPSGTRWSNQNENGLYTQSEAIQIFGKRNLPTIYELQELKEKCKWQVAGHQFKVIGPNGNYIMLQANGDGDECHYSYRVGNYGTYWSSTTKEESKTYSYYHHTGLGFYIDEKHPFLWGYQPEQTLSVRLVKRRIYD